MAETQTSPAALSRKIAGTPGNPDLRYMLAQALIATGDAAKAEAALRQCVRLNPRHDSAWMQLAELTHARGDDAGAEVAARHADTIHATAGALRTAMEESRNGHPTAAEHILRQVRHQIPEDSVTLRLLADICERTGRGDTAEALVAEALHLWPDCDGTEHHLAILYYRHNKLAEANTLLAGLRAKDPDNSAYLSLSALVETQLGETAQAVTRLEKLLTDRPDQPELWRSLGHARKAQGQEGEAVAAYRKAWALRPAFASAAWALANLKTFRFCADEIARMQKMANMPLPRTEACALHFALGKALSDLGDYPAGFDHYTKGNLLRRSGTPYRAEETHQLCTELALLPPPDTAGPSPDGPTPIFIVGLPRSGSTLLEQMLASHTKIEGTMELPDIPLLARRLCGQDPSLANLYAEKIRSFTPEKAATTGREYLCRTKIQRKENTPCFIDKRPDNFFHIPLIVRALPKAKIIDIRRHAMACGFSCYAQYFGGGHAFSYDLSSIGRYYTDYVTLMDAFDVTMPGSILHVRYERLVEDPETEIKRILNFCGVAFEEGCLSFYKNKRTVRTPSAAQVRRPINKDGLSYWQNFAEFLEPLQAALGPGIV